jgi:hypothetical protein
MLRALEELGSKMPLNEFNTMVCAFRVTKNSIISRADFMNVFNKASLALVSGSPKHSKASNSRLSRPSSSMRAGNSKMTNNTTLKDMIASIKPVSSHSMER